MAECQLVTGGAGFIGSHYVRRALGTTEDKIVIVDKLTYAGNLATLRDILGHPRVEFIKADIVDSEKMQQLFEVHFPRVIVNFAAESHVDRSIDGPRNFLRSNTVGVFELLEVARRHWAGLPGTQKHRFRFLQVSTDEVYGSLGPEGHFSESSRYSPRSPYSATKASADHLVRAYYETYGLPTLVTHSSNNYGPYQYPEKLLPLAILNALDGKAIPVYGDGSNIRDWIHVEDCCAAISTVLTRGKPGSAYNIGARNERTNREMVQAVCTALEELVPARENPELERDREGVRSYGDLITYVEDRPGHDFRYATDPSLIERELGWRARAPFADSLSETVQWYVENREWSAQVLQGVYGGERLGLGQE